MPTMANSSAIGTTMSVSSGELRMPSPSPRSGEPGMNSSAAHAATVASAAKPPTFRALASRGSSSSSSRSSSLERVSPLGVSSARLSLDDVPVWESAAVFFAALFSSRPARSPTRPTEVVAPVSVRTSSSESEPPLPGLVNAAAS